MTKRLFSYVLALFLIVGIATDLQAQRKKKSKETVQTPPPPKPKKGDILPYSKVITKMR